MIKSDEEGTQFVIYATHEIQTRLQSIIANAENLIMELPTLEVEEAQVLAREVLSSAQTLDTVVQNIGDFLGYEYHFEEKSLAQLVYEVRRIHLPEATRRHVEIIVQMKKVGGQPPKLEISQKHLRIALSNLIQNAIKYSFRGNLKNPQVVSISGQDSNGAYYKLIIYNFGIGILEHEIEEGLIFNEGYQGTLTKGEFRRGSGKGLYFTQQIIQRHSGFIDVESEPVDPYEPLERQPHHTRFTISLPYKHTKGE